MTVIDVDSHLEIAVPPGEHPLRQLRELVPSAAEFTVDALVGDLRRVTPPGDAPSEEVLSAMAPAANHASARYACFEDVDEPGFSSLSPRDRVKWMDQIGIDRALINPGMIGILAGHLPDRRAEAMRLCNDFAVTQLDGYTDRLSPVALIDWNHLDAAVDELTRMRGLGSRAFWMRAEPYEGTSPAHPAWDRVWSAATDLGMIAIIHVGNTPAAFGGGWGNAGWNQPGGTGVGGFFRYANSMRHQAAEMLLAGMLYGGVFGRHPNLTVITEELGVGWLPYFVSRCDLLSYAGPWPYDLTPGEMIRRNLRAAPLPGLGDPNPLTDELLAISDIFIFSSDFPHEEGNTDPVSVFTPTLDRLDEQQRSMFLGGNIAACFERMGDPL